MGQAKNFIAFLGALIQYNIPSPMVEMLTLWSPHKLLKNLSALSKKAKCSQSSTKKKLKSFLSILDTKNGKKTYHATVPLRISHIFEFPACLYLPKVSLKEIHSMEYML